MTDLVERLRDGPISFHDARFKMEQAATALEAKDKELAALRERVKAQRDFIKELSDALVSVRPLGGSELFVKRFDEYFADPAYCKAAIQQRSDDCHEAQKGLIRNRRRAETAERERDEAREALKALAHLSKGPVGDLVKHAKAIAPSIHALAVRAAAITGEKK